MNYDIKCVYCLKNIEPKEVLYKKEEILQQKLLVPIAENQAATENLPLQRRGNKSTTDNTGKPSQFNGMGGGNIRSMGNPIPQSNTSESDVRNTDSIYISLGEILNTDQTNGNEVEQTEYGFKVEKLTIDGKTYKGEISNVYKLCVLPKYCSHCHERLIEDVGKLPIYTVALVGGSDVGKTVFLTMQDFMTQVKSTEHTSLPNKDSRFNIDLEDSHIEGGSDGDIICVRVKNFAAKAEFPSSTQSIPPAHCIRVAYYRRGTDEKKFTECIVAFKDVLGDNYDKAQGASRTTFADDKEVQMAEYVNLSDAIFMFIDPEKFEMDRSNEEMSAVNANLQSDNIRKIQHDFFRTNGNALNKPVICLLTKEDEIYKKVEEQNCIMSTVGNTDYTVWPGLNLDFNHKDVKSPATKFNDLSKATKNCIDKMIRGCMGWQNFLDTVLVNAYYIPISSIGNNCGIIEYINEENNKKHSEKHLVTKEISESFYDKLDQLNYRDNVKVTPAMTKAAISALNSRFVELPLMCLLAEFGVIPPIYTVSKYEEPKKIEPPRRNEGVIWEYIIYPIQDFIKDIIEKIRKWANGLRNEEEKEETFTFQGYREWESAVENNTNYKYFQSHEEEKFTLRDAYEKCREYKTNKNDENAKENFNSVKIWLSEQNFKSEKDSRCYDNEQKEDIKGKTNGKKNNLKHFEFIFDMIGVLIMILVFVIQIQEPMQNNYSIKDFMSAFISTVGSGVFYFSLENTIRNGLLCRESVDALCIAVNRCAGKSLPVYYSVCSDQNGYIWVDTEYRDENYDIGQFDDDVRVNSKNPLIWCKTNVSRIKDIMLAILGVAIFIIGLFV